MMKNKQIIRLLGKELQSLDKTVEYRVYWKRKLLSEKEIRQHDWEVVKDQIQERGHNDYYIENNYKEVKE